ncbi:hypothetical protein TNCV_3148201 [Trichonephila clavipes]|nr:hypothetical protein TNCV_3148201 [Trichonephila clavipes]
MYQKYLKNLHWLGVAANEAYPLCGHARMNGDYLPQCTGLAEYPTDDIVYRYWEDRRQMVKKPSTGVFEFIIHKSYEWISFWQTEIKFKITTQNQENFLSVKNQRTEQALCKTSLRWNLNDAQLSNGGGRWSTPASTHVQRFASTALPDRPF